MKNDSLTNSEVLLYVQVTSKKPIVYIDNR